MVSKCLFIEKFHGNDSIELDKHVVCVKSATILDMQMSTGFCTANFGDHFDVCQQQVICCEKSRVYYLADHKKE